VRKLVYLMNISLDGYVEDLNGSIDWTIIDDEIHQFFNDQEREMDIHLYGRHMYEVMHPYWSTFDEKPTSPAVEVEYARIWNSIPTIVFSHTLDPVDGNVTLMRDGLIEEVTRLKSQPGRFMNVGGPTLAASLIEAGLVDEFRSVIHPIVLGGGKPFLPKIDTPTHLRLVETRHFASGAVFLRYQRADRG